MLERRQQPRFHPGTALSATLKLEPVPQRTGAMAPSVNSADPTRGRVEDVSSRGFKLILAEHLCQHLRQGQIISGILHMEGGDKAWQGNITHLHARSGGMSIGVALQSGDSTNPLKETVEQVVRDPKTGGISLRRQGDRILLDVIGHLSLALSRDFLHLIRSGTLNAINLNQCKGMDSAGLGMLCIAVDARIPLINANGIVRDLLEVARIPTHQEAESPKKTWSNKSNPIRHTSSGTDTKVS